MDEERSWYRSERICGSIDVAGYGGIDVSREPNDGVLVFEAHGKDVTATMILDREEVLSLIEMLQEMCPPEVSECPSPTP